MSSLSPEKEVIWDYEKVRKLISRTDSFLVRDYVENPDAGLSFCTYTSYTLTVHYIRFMYTTVCYGVLHYIS